MADVEIEAILRAARAVDAAWLTICGIGPQSDETVGAVFNARCMDLHNALKALPEDAEEN